MQTRARFLRRFLSLCLALACALTASAAEPRDARLDTLAVLVHDGSPKVRLEALRALAKIPSAEAASIALGVLDRPMDPTLDYALWLTINDLSTPWLAALQDGSWKPEGREKQLEFALRAIRPEQASSVLGKFATKAIGDREGSGPWIELIGAAGSPAELRALFDNAVSGNFSEAAEVRVLQALSDATRLRKIKPAGSLTSLPSLFEGHSEGVQVAALNLASLWREAVTDTGPVLKIAGDAATPEPVRKAAFGLIRVKDDGALFNALLELTGTNHPMTVRRGAAIQAAAIDFGKSSEEIVKVLLSAKDDDESVTLWRDLIGSNERYVGKLRGAYLAEYALPKQGVPVHVARAGMRVAREGGRNDLELVAALAKASGITANTQTFTAQLIKDLAAKAAAQGDPHRGEMVYRRPGLACMSCHAIGGAGGKVGPDMTSIGASAPIDYLVESVLQPNAKIKEGYHGLILTLKNGDETTGTLARETPQEIVLRNAAGQEQAVPKADIATREQSTSSLMPSGLLDALNEQEQLDLFAFLSRLGKPGDFDASKGGMARKWRLFAYTHTDQQNGRGNVVWEAPLAGAPWNDVLSLVDGRVTRPLIDEAAKREFWVGTLAIYAATEINLAQAGAVKFQLEASGAELWVDGMKVGAGGESRTDLAAGKHRVLVKLDPQKMPEALRLRADTSFVLE